MQNTVLQLLRLGPLIYNLVRSKKDNRGRSPSILIFDYKRDYSKEDFVKATGAKVIEPEKIPLNLFDTSTCTSKRPWVERHQFFTDVLSKIYGGIGPVQIGNIRNAVKSAYDHGYDPLLSEVCDQYQAIVKKMDSPLNIMQTLLDLDIFVDDRTKVVPFSEFAKGVVVVNLGALGQNDQAKNMLVAIFLNFFYEAMLKIEKQPFTGHSPRQLRFIDSFLLVDEADNIMKYEFDVLRNILLQGREFGVGVLLASQYLSHFSTGGTNYREPLLTWFIHKVPNITVQELLGIGMSNPDKGMVERIKKQEMHECLYKSLQIDGDFIIGQPFYKII